MAEQGALERGRTRVNLIRDLALGVKSKAQLMRELGCSAPSLNAFIERHGDEITDVRADLENTFAGLWVAKQTNRIAEIQQLIEDVSDQLAREVATGGLTAHMGVPLAKLLLNAYQQVAIELGQVAKTGQGVDPVPPTIVHNYSGFDPTRL